MIVPHFSRENRWSSEQIHLGASESGSRSTGDVKLRFKGEISGIRNRKRLFISYKEEIRVRIFFPVLMVLIAVNVAFCNLV